jgi:hypothetical protein
MGRQTVIHDTLRAIHVSQEECGVRCGRSEVLWHKKTTGRAGYLRDQWSELPRN